MSTILSQEVEGERNENKWVMRCEVDEWVKSRCKWVHEKDAVDTNGE